MKSKIFVLLTNLFILILLFAFSNNLSNTFEFRVGQGKLSFEKIQEKVAVRTNKFIHDIVCDVNGSKIDGSYTRSFEFVVDDSTILYFYSDTERIKDPISDLTNIRITKDSVFTRWVLEQKDTMEKDIKVDKGFSDTVTRINPVTMIEESEIAERKYTYVSSDLGNVTYPEVQKKFSNNLFLENEHGAVAIDTAYLVYFGKSECGNIMLTYPHPDKSALHKITSLAAGTLLVLDQFHVKSDELGIKTYYPKAMMRIVQ